VHVVFLCLWPGQAAAIDGKRIKPISSKANNVFISTVGRGMRLRLHGIHVDGRACLAFAKSCQNLVLRCQQLGAEWRSRPPSEADSRALLLHADQAGRQAVSKAAAAIDEILATQIRDLEASLAARGATRRRARSRRTRTGRGARQCRNRFADLGDGQSAERFSQCMLIKAALCQSSGILTHVAQRCAGLIG
jgi:hypothetical protein